MFEHFPGGQMTMHLMLVLLMMMRCDGVDDRGPVQATSSQSIGVGDVLRIAASRGPNAKQQLKEIGGSDSDASLKALASTILSLWRDDLNTYTLKAPRFLAYQGSFASPVAFAIAEVDVGIDGQPLSVRIIKTDSPQLQKEIEVYLMNRVYCPAHDTDQYRTGTAGVLLRREIRDR
jgi:hypothetical protein